ncbi:hypothetical protein CLAFUR0_14472 [Fulvia fulva]|nr:hypothetical protein CLAFUR0_14472 [Fulvia fulva]
MQSYRTAVLTWQDYSAILTKCETEQRRNRLWLWLVAGVAALFALGSAMERCLGRHLFSGDHAKDEKVEEKRREVKEQETRHDTFEHDIFSRKKDSAI